MDQSSSQILSRKLALKLRLPRKCCPLLQALHRKTKHHKAKKAKAKKHWFVQDGIRIEITTAEKLPQKCGRGKLEGALPGLADLLLVFMECLGNGKCRKYSLLSACSWCSASRENPYHWNADFRIEDWFQHFQKPALGISTEFKGDQRMIGSPLGGEHPNSYELSCHVFWTAVSLGWEVSATLLHPPNWKRDQF